MSATASAAPTEVKPSSPRRQHAPTPSDIPQRTQSMASRTTSQSSTTPHRSNSHSQTLNRPPSSSRQANLANVAKKDYEQTNLARPHSSSRRSSSADRYSGSKNHEHIEPQKSHDPPPSYRSKASRATSEAPSTSTRATNGASSDVTSKRISSTGEAPRRRTTISAQTGKWSLGKTIGAGSMGKVKLAKNMETGEQAAIKIVPRQSQDDHRSREDRERADHSKEVRTAREAAIVTLVNHPYICGMRDVVRTDHHWYMLFEYVNGGQMLDYIISHGRLKEKQARKFGRQIASALDYCHRNSIVHRDLKIENILISKTGDIKIIDFGLSNLFSPRNLLKTFCGSLYFAAPELLQAKAYTGPEVDVWSFGIVLYVLVCGKVPFDDQSMPQLHAKIKKGSVEYPPWLSAECKHIISRMLVTDPRSRATLTEIMQHPWMTKGFNGPPENHLPHREPLSLPLDAKVIEKMTGFDFGSPDYITRQLETVLQSEDYQRAIMLANRRANAQNAENERKRSSMFDFYQRRKSAASKDTLTAPSVEALHLGEDPVHAFSPLLSIYYLVREKQDRELKETNPGALAMPQSPGEKPLQLPDLPAPEAAHTNTATPEMSGEAPTGGRSRPRARTHGEDELADAQKARNSEAAMTGMKPQPAEVVQAKRESTAAGLFRRLSTRRGREPERPKQAETQPPQHAPSVSVSGPDGSMTPLRKSFSIRKKDRETPPSAYKTIQNQHPDLLAPPPTTSTSGAESPQRSKGLSRSTSVNSADLWRRRSRRGASESAAPPSPGPDSEQSSLRDATVKASGQADGDSSERDQSNRHSIATTRARSLGHARRESIQARRVEREQALRGGVPEETDAELAEESAIATQANPSQETMKPVYLKGLFSVSTTSNKPLTFIRSDIIRVLQQLGVEYKEMKGGFNCRHEPSIDLHKVVDNPPSDQRPEMQHTHRRKISFAGLRGDKERDDHNDKQPKTPTTPRQPSRRQAHEGSYPNSDDSEEETARKGPPVARAPGETTTQVSSDLGKSMVLRFEILVVKVPFLSLHGLQFKKVDGGTWQYKKMADMILAELRL